MGSVRCARFFLVLDALDLLTIAYLYRIAQRYCQMILVAKPAAAVDHSAVVAQLTFAGLYLSGGRCAPWLQ